MKTFLLAVALSALPQHAPSLQGFASKGWSVEASATGDLNGDGKPDMALVLKDAKGARVLAVGFGGAGGYDLKAQNSKLLPVGDSDPQQTFHKSGLGIKGRVLNLRIDYLRGNSTYSFRFQNGHFELIGYEVVGVAGGMMEEDSYNFSTGRMWRRTGPIDKDISKTKRFTLMPRSATILEDIDSDWRPPDHQ